MNDKYLITFYDKDDDVSIEVLYERDMLSLLDSEGSKELKDKKKFTVEPVGKCVIDWS